MIRHSRITSINGIWATIILFIAIAIPAAAAPYTIVIDAGHGAHDAGASGQEVKEKDINLGVALKLGKLMSKEMPGTKIVYTRDNDTYVTLQGRADIANKAKGDLFISIHTNSLDQNSPNRNTVKGTSVYTLAPRGAKSNLDVAMRENSVIKLEGDNSTKYEGFDPSSDESYIIFEMSQNKFMDNSAKLAAAIQKRLVSGAGRADRGVRQGNFWVLHATAMPSVLIELDFICNPEQEKYLGSEKGQQELAKAIFNGIKDYRSALPSKDSTTSTETGQAKSNKKATESKSKKKADNQKPLTTESKKEDKKTKKTTATASASTEPVATGTDYRIQFLISSRKIPAGSPKFHGLKNVSSYNEGGMIKYTYGSFKTEREAVNELKKIRKDFPDAFVIRFVDGKRIK